MDITNEFQNNSLGQCKDESFPSSMMNYYTKCAYTLQEIISSYNDVGIIERERERNNE